MKKFENFVSAYENLKDIYDYEEPYGNVELSGLVALFEICFEQAWKAMKEILDHEGAIARTGSPKQVLKFAYEVGMIQNEELWLNALNDRNNVSHSYNSAIALSIVKNTKEFYYTMFGDLKETIENEWI